MKILCIGDSNTVGYDPRSPLGGRYPAEVRWTDRLDNRLDDRLGNRLDDRLGSGQVINWGINGKPVPCDSSVFVDVIGKKDPDLVIVMFGSNDLLEGADAAETSRRMARFLGSIVETGKPVLLIAPPPFQYGECVQSASLIEESGKLEDLYREVAGQKGCLFISAREWEIEMAFDGIHFSPSGHAVFAQKLSEALTGYS